MENRSATRRTLLRPAISISRGHRTCTRISSNQEKPGVTSVAFDVAPDGQQWRLVLRPGSEFNEQVCQVSIAFGPLAATYEF